MKLKTNHQDSQERTTTDHSTNNNNTEDEVQDYRRNSSPKGTGLIMTTLVNIIKKLILQGETKKIWVSCGEINHIKSGHQLDSSSCTNINKLRLGMGDTSWGCGYRNLQMILSYLFINKSEFFEGLSSHPLFYHHQQPKEKEKEECKIPSIHNLQTIIEDGWKVGFDRPGGRHFNFKLVGKNVWIGTTEVYVALNRLGIRCQIVDFTRPTGPNGHHIKLIKWVEDYFQVNDNEDDNDEEKIKKIDKIPLYLQHKGHSRTIIGIEKQTNSHLGLSNLIILDPAKDMKKIVKKVNKIYSISDNDQGLKGEGIKKDNNITKKLINSYRLTPKNLSKHSQYQILYVRQDLGPLVPFEIDQNLHQPKFYEIKSIVIS